MASCATHCASGAVSDPSVEDVDEPQGDFYFPEGDDPQRDPHYVPEDRVEQLSDVDFNEPELEFAGGASGDLVVPVNFREGAIVPQLH